MNDLKAYTHIAEQLDAETGKYALYAYDVNGNHTPVDETELVYLKSDADKVFAELKKERDWLAKDRAQAYDDLEKRAQLNIKQEESIRHQKYKRCLAMAEICFTKGKEKQSVYKLRTFFWSRWGNRWWKLAEKFKPIITMNTNSTAKYGKGKQNE